METDERKETDILNAINMGIGIVEMSSPDDVRVVFFNHRMLEILGLGGAGDEDDPLLMDYEDDPLSCVHPADSQRVTQNCRDGYFKKSYTVDNFRLRDAGGSYIWLKETVSLAWEEGNVRRYYAAYQQVDDEIRLQYELTERLSTEQHLRAQADNANKMKSSFLSNVSHDMRTPLNAVIGYTELALATDDPSARQDYLEKIAKSSGLLKELINDTLDLSRIESGKMNLKSEAASLAEIIQKIVMTVRPAMDDKHIEYVMDVDERLNTMIYVDALRLQEILLNILSNAVKFTPDYGTIHFKAEALDQNEYEIRTRFTIKDSGIGMSEEFLQRIYEPFSQERTAETAAIEGSGLGLTIVKQIVDMMHGTIDVSSQLGKGTTFVVNMVLPLASKESGAMMQHPNNAAVNLKGMQILLVEDNMFNQEIARKILENQGASVETAGNGREGVDVFAASRINYFDAILMDIRMPVMDGYEATRKIRLLKREDALTVPIIAMSADAYAEDVRRSLAAGMNDHLAKPVEVDSLTAALGKYTGKKNNPN